MRKYLFFALWIINSSVGAQTFGPDKIIHGYYDSDTYDLFLQRSVNGYIYAGYNYHEMSFTGSRVIISKDDGITWDTLIEFGYPGASAWYPAIVDMAVGGTDTTNLKVVLALEGPGSGGPAGLGAIKTYDGLTGTELSSIILGDFMTYSIPDIALATDSRHPLSSSSPYSIAAVYSTSGSNDSLNMFYSSDGGNTFIHSNIMTDSVSFQSVDLSYGSYHNNAVGRFGLTFMRGNNLCVATSDVGIPDTFSNIQVIDTADIYTNGKCSNPMICMQSADYDNSSGDYSTVIVAQRNDSSTNDLLAFYLMDTQNGGAFYYEFIDSSANIKVTPSISFNENDSGFTITYFDTTANQLPVMTHSMNFPGSWNRFPQDYPDTLIFSNPSPVIDVSDSLICIWKQKGDDTGLAFHPQAVKFDKLDINLSAFANLKTSNAISVSPNPSFKHQPAFLTGSNIDKITIMNANGDKVFEDILNYANEKYRLPELKEGVYILKAEAGSKIYTTKFIRQ